MVEFQLGDEEAIIYITRTSSQKLLIFSIEGEEVAGSLVVDVGNTAVNSRDE